MNSIEQLFASAGQAAVEFIIGIAQILTKSESSPGVVAIALGTSLVIFGLLYFMKSSQQIKAISEMKNIIAEYQDISEFSEGFEEFRAKLLTTRDRSKPWLRLWESWDEYSETIVLDDVEGPTRLRNSIRPASFMNVEDLEFGPGVYRILPNTFVSIGLLLTFLGLVAALYDFSSAMAATGDAANVGLETAMTDFMQIASAKFIMSLVGLSCSILFTILLRYRASKIDESLRRLCMLIERRLVFVSLEDLGFRQLNAATEQREHLREIGFSMVAELRKPLDALPEQITSAISKQMDPIFEKVSSMGTSSMEGLVGDLSSQLSHSVGNALNRASESLGDASDRIGQMVDRMNSSNAQAGEGLQTALSQLSDALGDLKQDVAATGSAASSAMTEGADQLLGVMNETLAGIRDNTAQGAHAMSKAAEDMKNAAEGFRTQLTDAAEEGITVVKDRMSATSAEAGDAISGAGQSLLTAFEATGRQIADLGSEMGDSISEELLSKLDAVGKQLEQMAVSIERGVNGARSAADGLSEGARSISTASGTFDNASKSLISATEPLRSSHESIEAGLRILGANVQSVSDTLIQNSRQVADTANHVLQTAQVALGSEREGIRQSLEATRATLRQLSDEAEKLDGIDEMLGRALSTYSAQLESALGSAQDHITEMRDTLSPGIDTLRSVVEQAENFMPSQRRAT